MVMEDTRLASCPDESQVNRRRQEERSQGGPSVPHNSMDSSLVDLRCVKRINLWYCVNLPSLALRENHLWALTLSFHKYILVFSVKPSN